MGIFLVLRNSASFKVIYFIIDFLKKCDLYISYTDNQNLFNEECFVIWRIQSFYYGEM